MPKLPDTYNVRQTPTSTRGAQGYDTGFYERANRLAARNTIAAGEALGEAADQRQARIEEKAFYDAKTLQRRRDLVDKDAIVEAQSRENNAQRRVMDLLYGTDESQGLYSRKGGNALTIEKEFNENWKSISEEAMKGLDNPVARRALEKSLQDSYLSNLGNVKRYRSTERTGYMEELSVTRGAQAQERAGLEYNNNDTFKTALAEAEKAATSAARLAGMPEENVDTQGKRARSAVYAARIKAMINTGDPAVMAQAAALYDAAVQKNEIVLDDVFVLEKNIAAVLPKVNASAAYHAIRGAQFDKESMIAFVQDELEGGDILHKDGAGNARWGLNDAANPDLDLANMSVAEARRYADERYFREIEQYDLPKKAQLIAFDAAYNHGPAFAKKIIEATQGQDEERRIGNMMLMRKAEYERLAQENPQKHGKNFEGWMNRLERVWDKVNSDSVNARPRILDLSTAQNIAAGMDEDTGKEFTKLVENHNKFVQAQRMQEQAAVMDEAMAFYEANGAGTESMPNVLLQKAKDAGIENDLRDYKGASDMETLEWLYGMEPNDLKKLDLNTPGVRLKLSPQDYQKFQQKKARLDSAAVMVTEDVRNTLVNRAFSDIGINTGSGVTAKNKERKVRVNQLLDVHIDAFIAQNNGRSPTPAEIREMIDDIFVEKISARYGIFPSVSSDYAFDIEVKDIPEAERRELVQEFTRMGMTPTNADLVAAYLESSTGTTKPIPRK